VKTKEPERESDRVWAAMCQAEGWVCKLCGAVPECGTRFDGDLCDDCKLRLKIELMPFHRDRPVLHGRGRAVFGDAECSETNSTPDLTTPASAVL